jgi:bis(5'-nucleosyl)-tetraphosphatase (symmetrical)
MEFTMAIYAIGDVQGCHARLVELLDRIEQEDPGAKILFAGDLINRGPGSLATLRLVRSMGDRAEAVLGNHDLHLLAVANDLRQAHRSDTIDDILDAPDHEELMDWLRRRPLAMEACGCLIVHAGVLPDWSMSETLALAREVEAALQAPDWLSFMGNMYGNAPDRWNPSLSGHDRLRCIVNALTRMRFCSIDGRMELRLKDKDGIPPPGYLPWFDMPSRKTHDTTVVFGHWSARGLVMRPHVIGLDTGCVWGGKLTALRLEDRHLVQVECPQYQQQGE